MPKDGQIRINVVFTPETWELLQRLARADFPHSQRVTSFELRSLVWQEAKRRGWIQEESETKAA